MSLGLGHSPGNRGVTPVTPGRRYDVSAPVDCWISVSPNASGDAQLNNFRYAWLKGGKTCAVYIPAAAGAQFLSGITTDANGDSVPTQLTFTDVGASNI